jgi:hypothetical protein
MFRRELLVLVAIFVACVNVVYGMEPAFDSAKECLALAYDYVHEDFESFERDLVVKKRPYGKPLKLVKQLLGVQIVVCTMNELGNPAAFSWSKEDKSKNELIVVKLYSREANEIISEIFPDLNANNAENSRFSTVHLPTFPPEPGWVFAYSLSHRNYCASWHLMAEFPEYTSQKASNHYFFNQENLGEFTLKDLFILNMACILAIKNKDNSLVKKFNDNEAIRKHLKHIIESDIYKIY